MGLGVCDHCLHRALECEGGRQILDLTHTSEKDNTEYTSATVQAARIASTVISYTFLVLVHVQESYLQ